MQVSYWQRWKSDLKKKVGRKKPRSNKACNFEAVTQCSHLHLCTEPQPFLFRFGKSLRPYNPCVLIYYQFLLVSWSIWLIVHKKLSSWLTCDVLSSSQETIGLNVLNYLSKVVFFGPSRVNAANINQQYGNAVVSNQLTQKGHVNIRRVVAQRSCSRCSDQCRAKLEIDSVFRPQDAHFKK